MLEEVVALVIHENECREVLHTDFPDCLHSEFRVFDTFYALDVVLSKNSGRTSDGTEVETAVLAAGIGHSLAPVAFGEHNHTSAMVLELIHIRVHTACCGRAH